MSDAAFEEVSALSSIFCGEGEFRILRQSAQDGLVIQINCTSGGVRNLDVSAVFHLRPSYPSCPPDISVSSSSLSRTQCHSVRQKLLARAEALPPEPMIHQLIEDLQQQCVELTEGEEEGKESEEEEEWTQVLLLNHIRSQSRYVGLLKRWSHQLQLTGRLLLGPNILVILQGSRCNIKEFCRKLKTVKVDVDSTGKKCKERMLKVLIEMPSSCVCKNSLEGFEVNSCQSSSELSAVFKELNMTELYQQLLPSLSC